MEITGSHLESPIFNREIETPPGIHALKGFGHQETDAHISRMITSLSEQLSQSQAPPMLVFPLDGSLVALWELAESMGASNLAGFDIRFAAKEGFAGNRENPYILSTPTTGTEVRAVSRVYVVEDIADRLRVYNWMHQLVNSDRAVRFNAGAIQELPIPELWAFTKKASTPTDTYNSSYIPAAFPTLPDGSDVWVNDAFGLDSGKYTWESGMQANGHLTARLYTQVQTLERLANIAVIGTVEYTHPLTGAPLPGKLYQAVGSLLCYADFLASHSRYPDVTNHPLYAHLMATAHLTGSEKINENERFLCQLINGEFAH
ncbi:MAG: hypothetical protein ACE5DX_05715 [Candidatus Dojkabacteria bacterium]